MRSLVIIFAFLLLVVGCASYTPMRNRAQIFSVVAVLATAAVLSNAFGQVGLSIVPGGISNVVFRISNDTTNSIRLPSAGYVPLDYYIPINTNRAYAIFNRPEVDVGLWLTRDWRQVGTNWMFASHQSWRERLKIRTLKPGDTLDIVRSLGSWNDLILTNTNVVARFQFLIPKGWAEEYGLQQCDLCVTGLVERTIK